METKMHCFKRLGQRVLARTFERQVVKLHVALLNRFSLLGRPQAIAVASVRPGLGGPTSEIFIAQQSPLLLKRSGN